MKSTFAPIFMFHYAEDVEKKVQALSCYQTQMKKGNTTLSKDYILTKEQNIEEGSCIFQYAEAFLYCERQIILTSN